MNASGIQLSNNSWTASHTNAQQQYSQDGKQYKCSLAIFPERRTILMLLEQLSNDFRTASNKNAQQQYSQDGTQYKCAIGICSERRGILMLLECNLAIIRGRQAIKMLNSYISKTASNTNVQQQYSRTPSNIYAPGMQLSNNCWTASNINVQQQYLLNDKQ